MFTDIKSLWKFPVYTSVEQYRQTTGKEPPPYDHERPIQRWEDPAPEKTAGFFAIYDHALQKMGDKWKIDMLVVPAAWAKRVNLPPDAALPEGYSSGEMPPPLKRGLTEDEEIVEGPFGVQIRSRSAYLASLEQVEAFTARDRELLKAIARKVGAEV